MCETWRWVLPGWLQTLEIIRGDTEVMSKDVLMRVNVNYDYRMACIRVADGFWAESFEDQSKSLLHEFVHIVIEPLNSEVYAVERLLAKYVDSGTEGYVRERMEQGVERLVCDVTGLLVKGIMKREEGR
jgi:hypothetical protein